MGAQRGDVVLGKYELVVIGRHHRPARLTGFEVAIGEKVERPRDIDLLATRTDRAAIGSAHVAAVGALAVVGRVETNQVVGASLAGAGGTIVAAGIGLAVPG